MTMHLFLLIEQNSVSFGIAESHCPPHPLLQKTFMKINFPRVNFPMTDTSSLRCDSNLTKALWV